MDEQPRHHGTVLVIDDEPMQLDIIGMLLQGHGFGVLKGSNYHDAVELFEMSQDSVVLLITDVSLEHVDGCEIAAELQHLQPKLRVMFLSGYTGVHLQKFHGLQDTARNFLAKPYRSADLLERVNDVLSIDAIRSPALEPVVTNEQIRQAGQS